MAKCGGLETRLPASSEVQGRARTSSKRLIFLSTSPRVRRRASPLLASLLAGERPPDWPTTRSSGSIGHHHNLISRPEVSHRASHSSPVATQCQAMTQPSRRLTIH